MLDEFIKSHMDRLKPTPRIGAMPAKGWPPKESKNYAWVTDGRADIERFLCLKSCKINGVRLPDYMQGRYIDLKLLYKQHFHERYYRKMSDMLATWKLDFDGRVHSGLDDARQVARIMLLMLSRENILLECNRTVYMTQNYSFVARQLRN